MDLRSQVGYIDCIFCLLSTRNFQAPNINSLPDIPPEALYTSNENIYEMQTNNAATASQRNIHNTLSRQVVVARSNSNIQANSSLLNLKWNEIAFAKNYLKHISATFRPPAFYSMCRLEYAP